MQKINVTTVSSVPTKMTIKFLLHRQCAFDTLSPMSIDKDDYRLGKGVAAVSTQRPETADPVWTRLRQEADAMAKTEPMLAGFLHDTILKHRSLERALSFFLAGKLASRYLTAVSLVEVFGV